MVVVLIETAAGYGLYRVADSKHLADAKSVSESLGSASQLSKHGKLLAWKPFEDSKVAVEAMSDCIEGKLSSTLKKMLKSSIVSQGIEDELAVQDKSMAAAIQSKLGIQCTTSGVGLQLWRSVRDNLADLVGDLTKSDETSLSVSLAHSFSRLKLKFSPEKVDTMVIHAVHLLDELEKELNNYCMRLREWYGWHFPELSKIIADHGTYAAVIVKMGMRTNAKHMDFAKDFPELPSEMIEEVMTAAEVSMGVEITEQDLTHIRDLCGRITELVDYRTHLSDYLKARMNAIAPNLTHMVGEFVGARLIAHAGSLTSLAKHPSSTVQILGAEKALFRALKSRQNTPKYGLIYHASMVGQSKPELKGRISRTLAAKLSLCARVDALAEVDHPTVAVQHKLSVENRLKALESGAATGVSHPGARRPQSNGFGRPAGQQQPFRKPEYTPHYNRNMDSSFGQKRSFGGDSAPFAKRPRA